MIKEAMKLALEALESCNAAHITDGGYQWYDEKLVGKAVEAIEQALAEQPAQQQQDYTWPTVADYENDVGFKVNQAFKMAWDMARTTNSFLNLTPQPAQQEPAIWAISYDGKTPYAIWFEGDGALLDLEIKRLGGTACKMPLYTSPQPAQPQQEPAIGEKNVELGFYSNDASNGQQRELAGKVEMGQLVGNRSHESASNPDAKREVAVIAGIDEYGTRLDWYAHWVNFPTGTKLYTSPPAQQCKWLICQSEEYQQALAEQIKRELVGERPAPCAPAADGVCEALDCQNHKPAKQEPVAWIPITNWRWNNNAGTWEGLTDTSPPPQRKPLTDEQYSVIGELHWLPSNTIKQIHRDIDETVHGIKEKPNEQAN